MKDDIVTRYVLNKGKLKTIEISKKESRADIDCVLKRDKIFLKIMSNM